ncbi:MAG: phosphatase PAP2 family protein [Gemmataceae bacterium]
MRKRERLWGFLRRRLSPTEYLGLHLTMGLLICLAGVALFAWIAGELRDQDQLVAVDERIAESLHEHALRHPGWVAFFRGLTTLGNLQVLAGVTLLVALVLLVARKRLLAVVWLVAQVAGGLLNAELKSLYERPRPAFVDSFVQESSYAFPSGHSMGAMLVYGFLAYLLYRVLPRPWQRWLIVMAFGLLVLAIGFSRMYLGAHWLSDVCAGFLAGASWLAVCISAIEVVRRRRLGRHADV